MSSVSSKIKIGLERVDKAWPKHMAGARVGLLVHPASINSRLHHASDLLKGSRKFRLAALFGPQHGIRGETQDNMVEWEGFKDPKAGIPVYSLYGKTRKPTNNMLNNQDVMVVDLQDIGARYYTFIWTLALVLEACQETRKPVVVLDRPNPLGGKLLEGPVLDPAYASFVGLHRLPVRHAMTIGEIACYLQDVYYPELDLTIIRMEKWKRKQWFDETGVPWVLPSPNMPTLDAALVYPGMCLLEGTNLSEGRGTTRPFEMFGAPWIDPQKLKKHLDGFKLKGVFFREMFFLPTFQKHAGELCGGAQLHVLERNKFKPWKTAVALLKAVYELYPDAFAWKTPPYEYEEKLLPIDILAGTDRVRKEIEAGTELKDMERWWNTDLREFDKKTRKNYLLY